MLTAALIIGIISLIVLSTSSVLIAVAVSNSLRNDAHVLDRAHERWVQQIDKLTDKLLAHNWEEYVTLRSMQEEDEGGFFTPDEQSEEPTQIIRPKSVRSTWGSTINPPSDVEERLLAEDFTLEGDPIR